MTANRAAIVERYWYSIGWDVERLWSLDLPTTMLPIEQLIWHLDVPLWPHEGQGYSVTPREVLEEPSRYTDDAGRIERADPAYPIEVIWREDRWMILDGVHRLAQAARAGRQVIQVRVVPPGEVDWLVG